MKYNLTNIGPKEWLDYKHDITMGLFYSIRGLGHDIDLTFHEFSRNRLNIIIGADFLANSRNAIDHLIKNKIDYVIFETEYFDGKSLNKRNGFDAESYTTLLENSKFILTPYKIMAEYYANIFDKDQVHYTPWGYYEQITQKNSFRPIEKKFDAIFFGLLKGERKMKMAEISKDARISVKALTNQDPSSFQKYFIEASKYGLSLSYGPSERFVNPFRIYNMLANGLQVFSDSTKDDDGYLSDCTVCDFGNVVDEILSTEYRPEIIIEKARQYPLKNSFGWL